jgi:hypothetical protein
MTLEMPEGVLAALREEAESFIRELHTFVPWLFGHDGSHGESRCHLTTNIAPPETRLVHAMMGGRRGRDWLVSGEVTYPTSRS